MRDLLALLERYSPGYTSRIVGVDDSRLDEVEEHFGRRLPGFYRSFARAMGADAGRLLAGLDGYAPADIEEHYLLDADRMPPRRFLLVFYDALPEGTGYFLDLDSPSEEEGDFSLVRFPLGEGKWQTDLIRMYASLREMLFMCAMGNIHLPSYQHRAEYLVPTWKKPPEKLPSVEDAALLFERLGFVRLPYPRHCLLFERRDAAIRLYRPIDAAGFSFRVGMHDPQELRHFLEIVEDSTGMQRW